VVVEPVEVEQIPEAVEEMPAVLVDKLPLWNILLQWFQALLTQSL
jgi:hypothetical protein